MVTNIYSGNSFKKKKKNIYSGNFTLALLSLALDWNIGLII